MELASGGASILIRKDILQQQINIDTELQAIAVKAILHKPINICFIYILPHDSINEIKLNNLIEQISKPPYFGGWSNSHSTVWKCIKTNKKRKDIEKVINTNNLCILNNKLNTNPNPFTDSYSTIDLILCDPASDMDYKWNVYNDVRGSDLSYQKVYKLLMKIYFLIGK